MISKIINTFSKYFTLNKKNLSIDKNLIEKKKELEEFNEKSSIRKEQILKSQNE